MPRKRRTSRAAKKSDVNETSSPRTSSTTAASSTRRATRAKAESAPVTTRGARKTGKKVFYVDIFLRRELDMYKAPKLHNRTYSNMCVSIIFIFVLDLVVNYIAGLSRTQDRISSGRKNKTCIIAKKTSFWKTSAVGTVPM